MIEPWAQPTMLRWQLVGPRRPTLGKALVLGESTRAAVLHAVSLLGVDRMPDAFHGPGADGQHDHAYWLAEDNDGDGRVDHMLVYARSGLPLILLPALSAPHRLFIGAEADWLLMPVWMGQPAPVGAFARSHTWRALTAYVAAGRKRPGSFGPGAAAPDALLRWELRKRGLPIPRRITWHSDSFPGRPPSPLDSFQTATRQRRALPDAAAGFPEIEFAEPVEGPLALGFGAHFGLGLFMPVDWVLAAPQQRPSPPMRTASNSA